MRFQVQFPLGEVALFYFRFFALAKRQSAALTPPLNTQCVKKSKENFVRNYYIIFVPGSKLIEYKEVDANEVVEEPRLRLKTEWTEQLTSRLTIEKLTPADSGNYSCVPTMAEGASVNVHVINGKLSSIYKIT